MKGRPVEQLVYEYLFPKPRQTDPPNFSVLLHRHLILEVRQETHSFYGHLDTPEAKYPGLDYTNRIHRIRLSRWTWHRRLFRAFDGLRLTHSEIANLTKWEGSKWAKDRFEREHGFIIRDTTADGFPNYADPTDPYCAQALRATSGDNEDTAGVENEDEETNEDVGEEEEEDESDSELESVGEALNERLRERVAMRTMSGDDSMPLDEEWENWLKHAIESGHLRHHDPRYTDRSPREMIAAASAGRWNDVPEILRDIIRQALERERGVGPDGRRSLRYFNEGLDTLSRVAAYTSDRPPETAARRTRSRRTRPNV
ncbi:hypothetical protein N0V88_006395 [Collariella sp. IMI 366227]|nr:hypothetical protein N0V88_006395 [Collariella sp. IMI 366227]